MATNIARCCQPEGRVSAVAGRDKEEQERGTGLTAGARKKKNQSWGVTEPLSVGLAMTWQQWEWEPPPWCFFDIFNLASWKLRTS